MDLNNLDTNEVNFETEREDPENGGEFEGREGEETVEEYADREVRELADMFEKEVGEIIQISKSEGADIRGIKQNAIKKMTRALDSCVEEVSDNEGVPKHKLKEAILDKLPSKTVNLFESAEQEIETIQLGEIEEVEKSQDESLETTENLPSVPIEARSVHKFPETSIVDPESGEEVKLKPVEKLNPGGQKVVVVYESENGDKYSVAFALNEKSGVNYNDILRREARFLKQLNEAGIEHIPKIHSFFESEPEGSTTTFLEGIDSNEAFVMEYIEGEEGVDTLDQLDQVAETLQQIHEAGVFHLDFHLDQVLGGKISDYGLSIEELEVSSNAQIEEIIINYLSGTASRNSEPGVVGGLFDNLNNQEYPEATETLFDAARKKDTRSIVFNVLSDQISKKSQEDLFKLAPAFGISSESIKAYQKNSSEEKEDIDFNKLQRANRRLFGFLNQLEGVQLPPSVLANIYPSNEIEEISDVRSDVETAYRGLEESFLGRVKNFITSSESELNNENMGLKGWLEYLEENPESADTIKLINKVINENQEYFLNKVGADFAENDALDDFFKEFISDDRILDQLSSDGYNIYDYGELGEEILNIHN